MGSDKQFEQFFDRLLEAVKARRATLGLTQKQLAEKLGKPQSVVARFENDGGRDPRLSMLFHVCAALKISPSELMGDAFSESSESDEKHANLNRAKNKIDILERQVQGVAQELKELKKLFP